MTKELAKMLAGQPYLPSDPDLTTMRKHAKALCRRYNASDAAPERRALLDELFGALGPGADIESPFMCDYGVHIRAGKSLYMNHGCVILDAGLVSFGDHVLLGPYVQIYAVNHPLEPNARRAGFELTAPVVIGNNVWLGGGVIVCPGVTIGDNTAVGAGSVVTKSLPANVLAVGNPCRVVRSIAGRVGLTPEAAPPSAP